MKKLFEQIIKFGIVGFICFIIDFGLVMLLKIMGVHYLIAGLTGFIVSVIANYLLSFKFVFQRKDNLDRKKEFIIFVALSAVGCGLNELILYVCMDLIYNSWVALHAIINENQALAASKILATGIVMVYNFITRKAFLEKKAGGKVND